MATIGSATLNFAGLQTNPIRATLVFNGLTFLREYPNKQAAIDSIQDSPDVNTLDNALKIMLKFWAQTDPNFNNLAGLVGKTATITLTVTLA